MKLPVAMYWPDGVVLETWSGLTQYALVIIFSSQAAE